MRLVPLAKIVTCHGVHGFVRLRPFNRPPSPELCAARELWVSVPGGPAEPRTVEAVQPHPHGIIVKLAGVDTRTAAEALVGAEVALPETALPAPAEGEFYHYEIVGFRVRTTTGVDLGTIRETLPTGGNDVWVVRDDAREHLIPVIADVVRTIDRSARTVTIEPLPGLLDL
jgi:16S rRNA processing protein RimM